MVDAEHDPPHPPTFNRCECVLYKDILENVDRALRDLSKAPVVKGSPLLDRDDKNLWITAGQDFLAHLRHVGIRKPVTWNFKVVSDAELTTAWLGSVALQGKDILDPDAYAISTQYITIPDLVVPPDLLVIRMGIKVARMAPAPEVLAEALNTRLHEGKPTWIWDEPTHPLNTGHLFWSDTVGRILSHWEHLTHLDAPTGPAPKKGGKTAPGTRRPGPEKRKSLRGGGS